MVETISYLHVLLKAPTVNYGPPGATKGVINQSSNCSSFKLQPWGQRPEKKKAESLRFCRVPSVKVGPSPFSGAAWLSEDPRMVSAMQELSTVASNQATEN